MIAIKVTNTVKKLQFVFVLVLLCSLSSYSRDISLGFYGGGSYSKLDWFTTTGNDEFFGSNLGLAFGGSVSLFQKKKFGIRGTFVYSPISLTASSILLGASSQKVSGYIPYGFIVGDFNFDLFKVRHSIGIGYGYGSLAGMTITSSSYPDSSTISGVVIDGKQNYSKGWFGYGTLFLPKDNLGAFYSIWLLSFGFGYEFGGKS